MVNVTTSVVAWPYGHWLTVGGQEVIVYTVVLENVEVIVAGFVLLGYEEEDVI